MTLASFQTFSRDQLATATGGTEEYFPPSIGNPYSAAARKEYLAPLAALGAPGDPHQKEIMAEWNRLWNN
jgi:hypothetical protein